MDQRKRAEQDAVLAKGQRKCSELAKGLRECSEQASQRPRDQRKSSEPERASQWPRDQQVPAVEQASKWRHMAQLVQAYAVWLELPWISKIVQKHA